MPIYEYAPTSGRCDKCSGVFEVMQRLAEAKLTTCPSCGQACERRISKVAIGGNWSLTDSKIQQSGLTQYKKVEQGVYEKTAGTSGPQHLFRD